jgi:hypothetical protein
MPLAKLKKYINAYGIKADQAVEKDDLIDAIIAAIVSPAPSPYVPILIVKQRERTAACLTPMRLVSISSLEDSSNLCAELLSQVFRSRPIYPFSGNVFSTNDPGT